MTNTRKLAPVPKNTAALRTFTLNNPLAKKIEPRDVQTVADNQNTTNFVVSTHTTTSSLEDISDLLHYCCCILDNVVPDNWAF
jgi:hypothetical protein